MATDAAEDKIGTLYIGRKAGECVVIGNVLFVIKVVLVNHNFVIVKIANDLHRIDDGREVRLSRNDVYQLSPDVSFVFTDNRGQQARLTFHAPKSVRISRSEHIHL